MLPITAAIVAALTTRSAARDAVVDTHYQTLKQTLSQAPHSPTEIQDALTHLEMNPIAPTLQAALDRVLVQMGVMESRAVQEDLQRLLNALQALAQPHHGHVEAHGNYIAQAVGPGAVAVVSVLAQTPPPERALHQLPAFVADFTGRERELAEADQAIRSGAASVVGIVGMGGIGKSAFATFLAHQLADAYPDAQLFLSLQTSSGPLTTTEALARLLRKLQPEEALPDSEEEMRARYLALLNERQAIIVLDNAVDQSQVTPLLPPAGSLALVTTRSRFVLPGLHLVRLAPLSPPEARSLVRTIAPHAGEAADTLAALCGYLPLALRAAASLLAVNEDLAPEEYLDQLADERSRLEAIGAEGVDSGLEATFNTSYTRLPPNVAGVFARLSVFPADFDRLAEETIADDPNHAALSHLVRHSLVAFDPDTQRYRLHDLIRSFAATKLSAVLRAQTEANHADFFCAVAEALCELFQAEEQSAPADCLALFEREWPNVAAGRAWAYAPDADREVRADWCVRYAESCEPLLQQTQHARVRVTWAEDFLKLARDLGDLNLEASGAYRLARALKDAGDPLQALGHFERARDLAHAQGDQINEASAVQALADTTHNLGRPADAIPLYEQALALVRSQGVNGSTYGTLANLASAHASLGHFDLALTLYDQALTDVAGQNDPRKAAGILNGIGEIHRRRGADSIALSHYEQALSLYEDAGDLHGVATVLGNIGILNRYSDDTQGALECYELRLAISRKLGDRRMEGTTLGNIGIVHGAAGDYDRAIPFFQQQLEIARETNDRHSEGVALSSLGNVYHGLHEPGSALEFYQQSLEIATEIGDPQSIALDLRNIARCYSELKYGNMAIQFYGQALAIARELGDQRGELSALEGSGQAHLTRDSFAAAVSDFQECVDLAQALGDDRALSDGLVLLAQAHQANGNPSEAIKCYTALIPLTQTLGEDSVRAVSEYNLAGLLAAQGATAEALSHARVAAGLFEQLDQVDRLAAAQALVREISEGSPSNDSRAEAQRRFVAAFTASSALAAQGDAEAQATIEEILPAMTAAGWHIADPIRNILAGERDAQVLLTGLDATEREIVREVLRLLDDTSTQAESLM